MTPRRVLILGGTAEARVLAGRLAARTDLAVTLSLAGRTGAPAPQPVPVRVGGFGGAGGLARHLALDEVAVLVDATHPFAARISANAAEAAARANVPLIVLVRPEWRRVEGDRWQEAGTLADAVDALGPRPRRAFAAIGRQEAAALLAAPQHDWLIRSIEPIAPPLALRATYILGRGPFDEAAERALFARHRVDAVLTKNSGGAAAYPKIAAARALGIEVFVVRRPPPPPGPVVETVAAAEAHVLAAAAATARGV